MLHNILLTCGIENPFSNDTKLWQLQQAKHDECEAQELALRLRLAQHRGNICDSEEDDGSEHDFGASEYTNAQRRQMYQQAKQKRQAIMDIVLQKRSRQ